MPRYNELVRMQNEVSGFLRPQHDACCPACMLNVGMDPMTKALALTLVNGWFMANADATDKRRDKFLYYTAAGLINLYLFKD